MTDKPDEPIIDACLDEVLGGRTPPDLTERILHALSEAEIDATNPPNVASAAPTSGGPTAQPPKAVQVRNPRSFGKSSRRASPWTLLAASLAFIAFGGALVWVARNQGTSLDPPSNQIATSETPPRHSSTAQLPQPESVAHVANEPPPSDSFVKPIDAANPSLVAVPGPNAPTPDAPPDSALATAADQPLVVAPGSDPPAVQSIPELKIADERPIPIADQQVVLAINQLIRNGWQSNGVAPALPASNEQWCERVYLKLIGRVPNANELDAFVGSRSPRKREQLVDQLLQGETYIEEFASHWSRTWSDILLASAERDVSREGLEQYLRRAFGQGQPFDETTYELLTATGSVKIGSPDQNSAVGFLSALADPRGVHTQATARVSRTFMGLSLDCSQCHADGVWSGVEQRQFWELNAFFRQMRLNRADGNQQIVDVDFPGEGGTPENAEIYYTFPNGLLRAVYPVFIDGTEIPLHGSIDKVNRRDLMAKLVTRSERFRQAMANRFWAEMFGVGFTIPADDIGPHNPPSHPELLAKLGGQFAAYDYDVRKLIRWIALSEPFALSSGDVATHDQIGARLAFDRFPRVNDSRAPVLSQLRVAREAYASVVNQAGALANPARVNSTPDPGAIPTEINDVDKLLTTVGANARGLSKSNVYGNYILGSNMSLEQKVQHMFFATLHRAPTAAEQKAVEDVLADTGASDARALEYIWWALAASQEAR